MKQYNRIMLGEHGKYLPDCLENNYVGTNFLPDIDLSAFDPSDEANWRKQMVELFLQKHPDKSIGTARNSIGFLWTVCYGLKDGDIVLASNGEGKYRIGKISGDYYYVPGGILPHRRKVSWLSTVVNRKDMSKELQNSTGSIGTCCNITKYAAEIEGLIGNSTEDTNTSATNITTTENYTERSLHRLLANAMLSEGILTKTIFHEKSTKSDPAKWVHPDMVGVRFNEFQDKVTRTLLKAADTKEYLEIYSFELKKSINNDHELKQAFFQALSNSNWANFGYLVAFEINNELREEMERLNRSFGIGIIRLSPFDNATQILFQARKNDVDYYTVDKLCKINSDFRSFMERTAKVLNAGADVVEDVKNGLEAICDKGFPNEDELVQYCVEKHIPLSQ
ncbi:MAG: hypothetical protein NC453_11340 [Muribaculum sp.]|nr:hypothetical protein [Muribaculum sp.]